DKYIYREYQQDEILPWDHLNCEISKNFLREEYEKSKKGILTGDCRDNDCTGCGVCVQLNVNPVIQGIRDDVVEGWKEAEFSRPPVMRFRVQFSKSWELRFVSHLDLVRAFERAIRRAGIPAAYSQGYHPHMRLKFGPPLAVGLASSAEWVDVDLSSKMSPETFKEKLNASLPRGLKIQRVRESSLTGSPSLASIISLSVYRVYLEIEPPKIQPVRERIDKIKTSKEIMVLRKNRPKNIRPFIHDISLTRTDSSNITLEISLRLTQKGGGRLNEILDLFSKDVGKFIVHYAERVALLCRKGSRWISP
ncbi:MAG: DUF2344 domain-containing protein, partial [Candidatus Eremiobacteraeota bacterium]|nr:DUF2344 domain-containing protein [Candidatus Eremiobacteraeota bacterium]